MSYLHLTVFLLFIILVTGCTNNSVEPVIHDPDTAEKVIIDRFGEEFGTLYVRDGMKGYPGPGEPVNFDQEPFITSGLGPQGQKVKYYNFDVLPLTSAPIYVFFEPGGETRVEGQLNVVDVVPGDEGYNDFWHIIKVIVPDGYVANSIASVSELNKKNYTQERTNRVVNCPVVPEGSTAELRYRPEETGGLDRGWYKKKIVYYMRFEEKDIVVSLPAEGSPPMPLSDIYVTFNINPGQPGGGPPSGLVTEAGTDQTHNVLETIPEDDEYSPFWSVIVYDNADFNSVSDLATAMSANILASGVMLVNCPVVYKE